MAPRLHIDTFTYSEIHPTDRGLTPFQKAEQDDLLFAHEYRVAAWTDQNELIPSAGNIFRYTESAKRFAKYFPHSFYEALAGRSIMEYASKYVYIPSLDLKSLHDHFEVIRGKIRAFNHYFIPNIWDKSYTELSHTIEIYCVTSEDCGKIISVHNLFTGLEEDIVILNPKNNDYDSQNKIDYLGCYCPKTGTIFMWLDRIYEYRIADLLFQKVILHEYIHALMDTDYRIKKGDYLLGRSSKEEETWDNLLVLLTYHNSGSEDYAVELVESFIRNQPTEYAEALSWYDKYKLAGWNQARTDLTKFLTDKPKKHYERQF